MRRIAIAPGDQPIHQQGVGAYYGRTQSIGSNIFFSATGAIPVHASTSTRQLLLPMALARVICDFLGVLTIFRRGLTPFRLGFRL